jgi:formate-dependent nitrite reductase cytochrome c552 subunit
MKLNTEKSDTTRKNIETQDDELNKLREMIDEKQKNVNNKLKEVEEARKTNEFEEEKNRKYSKVNAALKAKLKFIETKYDYTSSAKSI